MCLYPRLIRNRKYVPNKKNGGTPPEPKDKRTLMVPVGCQKCIECKKQKGRNWSIRLQEEIRTDKTGQFVTLTFSDESVTKIMEDVKEDEPWLEGYDLDNATATRATRLFLERWRKETGKSVKHWLVTELGHNGTENIHMHGIIFTRDKKAIKRVWQYGFVYIGDYVNERTVNYCIKYTTKMDLRNKEYNAKVLTSPGIGGSYTQRLDAKMNAYKPEGQTRETYRTRQGYKIALPIYYRNKIYTEDEREKLWLEKLDKNERFVLGRRIDMSNGPDLYYNALAVAQAKNRTLGYGSSEKDWKRLDYENQRRRLNQQKRVSRTEMVDTETGEIYTE